MGQFRQQLSKQWLQRLQKSFHLLVCRACNYSLDMGDSHHLSVLFRKRFLRCIQICQCSFHRESDYIHIDRHRLSLARARTTCHQVKILGSWMQSEVSLICTLESTIVCLDLLVHLARLHGYAGDKCTNESSRGDGQLRWPSGHQGVW